MNVVKHSLQNSPYAWYSVPGWVWVNFRATTVCRKHSKTHQNYERQRQISEELNSQISQLFHSLRATNVYIRSRKPSRIPASARQHFLHYICRLLPGGRFAGRCAIRSLSLISELCQLKKMANCAHFWCQALVPAVRCSLTSVFLTSSKVWQIMDIF